MKDTDRNGITCTLWFGLLLVFGVGRADYWKYVDYYDMSWSPDSRLLAYTFALDAFEGAYFPHEAVAYVSTDDTTALPVVITPPLDRVFPFNGRSLAAWSDHDGWFVLDLEGLGVARHIGAWCSESPEADFGGELPNGITSLTPSPDGSLVAGTGLDVPSGSPVLLSWRLGEPQAAFLALGVGDFRWRDDSVVVCSVLREEGPRYIAVNTLTGARRSVSSREYAAFDTSRVRVEVPVRPALDVGGDEEPGPPASESLLLVAAPGVQPRRIRLPVAGLPANPVVSPDGSRIALDIRNAREAWVATLAPDGSGFRLIDSGWAPQWLGSESLLYHNSLGFGIASTADSGRRQVYYPRTAHHPRWLSDSVIEFRVGRAGPEPEPLHLAPSEYRHWSDFTDAYYLARDTHYYMHDVVWQFDIGTGRFSCKAGYGPEPVVRIKSRPDLPVVSPDSRRTAVFNERWDVEVRQAAGQEGRVLLERHW